MKKKGILLLSICMILTAGCGGSLPDLTEEEMGSVSEYAAITLLKYDANSKSRLVDLSRIPEEPVVVPEEQNEPETNAGEQESSESNPEDTQEETEQTIIDRTENADGTVAAQSLEEFMGLPEGVSLSYTGYTVTQSYPEEDASYLSLEASEGKKLMVLHFEIKNQSGTDQQIRFIEQHNSYRVTVNESYTRSALTTILDNDLSTFAETLADGTAGDMVLLIEIDSEMENQIDSVTLNFKNEQKTYTIQE